MTKKAIPIKASSTVPWLIATCALFTSVANLVMGIILLATNKSGGDIAIGVLTVVFACWGIVGSLLALIFIVRQNRYNRSQANFIAQVSHELRTPITSIRMYADTLMMHRFETEDEEDELLRHMDDEINRLEQLTEHILEARRQREEKRYEPVAPEEIVMAAMQPYLDNPLYVNRINLRVDSAVARVAADPVDLRNVVSNLVQNALTHGGDGRIHVSLEMNENAVAFSVRDEGKGIAADMMKKIFEPFQRGKNTTESGIPGFGLGLSIVRDFCKQYGARIDVSNHDEGGAIFRLSLRAVTQTSAHEEE